MSSIKIAKARKKSSIGSMPMTWRVHLDAVPPSVVSRLTSSELAELLDGMRGLTIDTKSHHERDIVDEGAIWDERQSRLREIAK
jgi:hypothetical protein